MTPVRWGFLGAGFVASRALAPAVHEAAGAVLQIVGAREAARALELEPVRAAASYDEVLASDDVDAVYISLPNDAHLPWVAAALEAGKHVLCEKPLGRTADEVAQMAAVAGRTGLHLVEAAWNRWHPRTRRVEELLALAEGDLEVRTWFTFTGVPGSNYRLDPAHGGGALLDVGVYAIAAALAALGPGTTTISARHDLGPTGVDLTTAAELRSDRGRASVLGSFDRPESQGWTAAAPGLLVDVPHPAFTSWREESALRVVRDGVETVERFAPCDAYQLMVEQVSRHIRGEGAWVLPMTTSLEVARVVDDVARAAAS